MNFSLKQALKVLVVFACAVGVVGTSVMITNKNTDNAKNKNDSLWNVVDGSSDSDDDDSNSPTSGPNGEPLVSKTESQVGKYADIDGDGNVDGIIFADLMVGGSGQWNNNNDSTYNIPTISSSKDYYVSQKNYTNKLGGTADVLTTTGEGADRFYVMALEDYGVDSNNWVPVDHDWYNSAFQKITDYNTVTKEDFGTGKQNTINMIDKWNSETYGIKNACSEHTDLWNEIQTQVNNGWFVPSRAEWSAFGTNLGLTSSNYLTKNLSNFYWSSSLMSESYVYISNFNGGCIIGTDVSAFHSVRLATTF